MPANYIVSYQGPEYKTDEFINYYQQQHAQILQKFTSITSLVLHQATNFQDPFPVTASTNTLVAQMTFKNLSDLNLALQSEARAMARKDFQNFLEGNSKVTHQAYNSERIF